jgi:hypothetical protein
METAAGDRPLSSEDWVRLSRRHCAAARNDLSGKHTSIAWLNAGLAVECALKAAIMWHHRLNGWPSRANRPDFYTHDLAKLAKYAGVDIGLLIHDPIFPAWCVVRQWQRGDSYNPKPMPMQVARDMVEAACGANGVIAWLNVRFRLGS